MKKMKEYLFPWDDICNLVIRAIRGEVGSIRELYSIVTSKEVVRCRDCKWWSSPKDEYSIPRCLGMGGICWQRGNNDGSGFCSWGEGKDK